MESQRGKQSTAIIGAGPAGLTAALELGKLGRKGVVFEASDAVGGISRSVEFEGCRLDIGGHRFFTKVPEVEALWHEILGDELLVRQRLSRIYLSRPVLRLPPQTLQRSERVGIGRIGSRDDELPQIPTLSDSRRDDLRRVGQQSLWPPTLRDLLPDLHRKGVGHAVLRDQCRMGRPAHQEPQPADGGEERFRSQRDPRRRRRGEPDRELLLPASRTRHDVGKVPRRSRRHMASRPTCNRALFGSSTRAGGCARSMFEGPMDRSAPSPATP